MTLILFLKGKSSASSHRYPDFLKILRILAERYTVRALFAPEHGLYGCEDAGAVWEGEKNSVSGIPLYSLYRQDGQDFKPAPRHALSRNRPRVDTALPQPSAL